MKYDAIIFTDSSSTQRIRPLGAYVISNTLREHGYTCLVIDFFTRINQQKLMNFLEKFIGENTLFVGYSSSLLTSNSKRHQYLGVDTEHFIKLNEKIKQLNPKTKIVFGGGYTPMFSQYCLRSGDNLGVDYLMHGYSENMILDFVDRCRTGKTQKFSKKNHGLYEIDYDYKGDSFKFCDKKHVWHDDDFIFQNESLPLELSRGCIFKCKFCAYPLLGKNKNDLTYLKTEENILEEILTNYDRFKTTNYQIIDDTFNERTDKLETLLKVRDKSKLDLTFVGYNRLDLIHRFPEQIDLFKDLNFSGHFFGIETFNYESSKIVGKGLKEKDATETLHKIKDRFNNKVNITAGFIVGLPKETRETFSSWFLRVIDNDYPIDSFIMSALFLSETTHTKSEFFSDPAKYGYSFERRQVGNLYEASVWKNDQWSQKECMDIVKDAYQTLYETGRNKATSFFSMGASSFEKDFSSVLNVALKDANYDYYEKKLNERIDEYVLKLENL
jgi:radical SAM superfamily enzyme YgiQ (UPF0313 family)